jgi:DNA-binding beta-propeller fold protein YncE
VANRVVEIDSNSGEVLGDFVPTTDTHLSGPRGLAFWSDNALVLNAANGTVQRYDLATGDWAGELIGPGVLVAPTAMTIGPMDELLVAEDSGRVLRFDASSGTLLGTLIEAGTITGAAGLVVHPDGMLLVSDSTSNGIHAFALSTGIHLGRWDTGGLASGFWELLGPGTLRMGPGGHVLIATTDSNTAVQRYNRDTGLFQRSFYVLEQLSPRTVSFDVMPPSEFDCNANMRIDACEIADGSLADHNANGVPDACECIADLSGDGSVGVDDILALLAVWGSPAGDVTGDGTTGVDDLLVVLDAWGGC